MRKIKEYTGASCTQDASNFLGLKLDFTCFLPVKSNPKKKTDYYSFFLGKYNVKARLLWSYDDANDYIKICK